MMMMMMVLAFGSRIARFHFMTTFIEEILERQKFLVQQNDLFVIDIEHQNVEFT